jgi:DNA mismatch endonuclease (patch repair protein)
MIDSLSAEDRSRHMANIRQANTTPERLLRAGLHRAGLRYRLHRRDLPGRPDIVLPKYSAVIFVHGCFWHQHSGCRLAVIPQTRRDFWLKKFRGNRDRDRRQVAELAHEGWRVLTVWECGVRNPKMRSKSIAAAVRWVRGTSGQAEIPSGT